MINLLIELQSKEGGEEGGVGQPGRGLGVTELGGQRGGKGGEGTGGVGGGREGRGEGRGEKEEGRGEGGRRRERGGEGRGQDFIVITMVTTTQFNHTLPLSRRCTHLIAKRVCHPHPINAARQCRHAQALLPSPPFPLLHSLTACSGIV